MACVKSCLNKPTSALRTSTTCQRLFCLHGTAAAVSSVSRKDRSTLYGCFRQAASVRTNVLRKRSAAVVERLNQVQLDALPMSNHNQSSQKEVHETTCIYLDYNATTPILKEVALEMEPFLHDHFGNPSSSHSYAKPCRDALAEARERVATMIGANASEIVFTSCGTESDNMAIYGVVLPARRMFKGGLPHVVTSAVEHPAVLEFLKHLESHDLVTYTVVEVNEAGVVDPVDIEAALRPETVLISTMHSNNEVGTIQPIQAIAAVAKRKAVTMHTDAAQSIGKLRVNVKELGVDLLTLVGHKFGAPKGIAALYIRSGTAWEPMLYGGGQEGGLRSGTPNVLLSVGLGKASDLVTQQLEQRQHHMKQMRDQLQQTLEAHLPKDVGRINGPKDPQLRLPNTLSISIRGVNASAILRDIGDRVAASSGSACHSDPTTVLSPVMEAMKVAPEYIKGTFRFSVAPDTTQEEVDTAAQIILEAVDQALGHEAQTALDAVS